MIRVLIQVEAGSCDRRVYDERTLEYLETRRSPLPYPYPYGFVLGTSAADGDCVDCYLITRTSPAAGAIVECEPLGLLQQEENGEADHKVLASLGGESVPPGEELLSQLRSFIAAIFETEQGSQVRVGPILPREAALDHLRAAIDESC